MFGNIATSFDGTLTMSYSFNGGTPAVLPSTLTLVNGTASSDVTWPVQDDGDITVNLRGSFGTGALPPPKTFTREVAIASDRPAANATVVAVPPATPGGSPTYQLSVPDQNVVINGIVVVKDIQPPTTTGGPIVLDLSAITTSGSSVIVPITVSDPVTNGTALIVDTSTQTGASGTTLVNTATGDTVLQAGTVLTITGDLSNTGFKTVGTTYPSTVGLTTGTNQESQTMVAFAVAPPQCPAGSTWSPLTGRCV